MNTFFGQTIHELMSGDARQKKPIQVIKSSMSIFVLGVFFVCYLFGDVAFAADITSAEILNFGIYSGSYESIVTDTNSPTSRVRLERLKLEKRTEVIPARAKIKFGFQFILHGNPKGVLADVRCVFLFPPMTNSPSGKILTRYEAPIRVKLEDKGAGMYYDLVEPWELVPGKWTFQIFDGNKKLLEKGFTVTKD